MSSYVIARVWIFRIESKGSKGSIIDDTRDSRNYNYKIKYLCGIVVFFVFLNILNLFLKNIYKRLSQLDCILYIFYAFLNSHKHD